jgi:hypothetical protein
MAKGNGRPKTRINSGLNIVRLKNVLRITRKGADFGSVVRHPAAVERIGTIHRKAQADLNAISRKLDPNLHKKR